MMEKTQNLKSKKLSKKHEHLKLFVGVSVAVGVVVLCGDVFADTAANIDQGVSSLKTLLFNNIAPGIQVVGSLFGLARMMANGAQGAIITGTSLIGPEIVKLALG